MTYLLNIESFQVAATCLERKQTPISRRSPTLFDGSNPLGLLLVVISEPPPDQAEIITSTDKEHGLHGVNLPSETHHFSWGKSTISMAIYPVRKTCNYQRLRVWMWWLGICRIQNQHWQLLKLGMPQEDGVKRLC